MLSPPLASHLAKRVLLVFALLLAAACAKPAGRASYASPEKAASDESADVWLVPVDDFPAAEVEALLHRLRADLPWLQFQAGETIAWPDNVFYPDGKQVAGHKMIESCIPLARSMPRTKSNGACVFLITHDLNLADRRLRFLFAVRDLKSRVGVVSTARMHLSETARAAPPELRRTRLYKMVKRQVGELRLGLSRVQERDQLMYSPLMGLPDLDRIGTEF